MKSNRTHALSSLGILTLVLAARLTAVAGDLPPNPKDGIGGGTVPTASSVMESLDIKIPPKTQLPEDMKQLVSEFRRQAESYVSQQKELQKLIKGATTEDRERLKEQLKMARETFLDQTRDIRNDIKERIKDLKTSIRESRPQAAGSSEGGGRKRHGGD